MRIPVALAVAVFVTALAAATAVFSEDPIAQAAQPASCLSPGSWYSPAEAPPQRLSGQALLERIARHEIVLLGEQHDNPGHHQWQLQTLAALHLLRPDMVIGFEAFPRRLQPVLDRWIAGELSVKQFLEQTEWGKVWNFPPELYLPLFHFARVNRIPIAALNVDRTLTEAVRKRGWDAVPAEQKEGLTQPAPASQPYREFLFAVFEQHESHSHGHPPAAGPDDPAFQFFVESQVTWDRAMAEVLARRARSTSGAPPLVVGIAGSGHVRGGQGIPAQLRDLGVESVAVLLPVDSGRDCAELKDFAADAVFALPAMPGDKTPPPRLGVRLQEAGGEVRITEVVSGSLAEKSGLQRGDHIVSIAGEPVLKTSAVVAAVRAQPAGTWLPMAVRRDQQQLELIVKFPRE